MKKRLCNLLSWLLLVIVFLTVYTWWLGGTVLDIINNFKNEPIETSIILAVIVAVVALLNIVISKVISNHFHKD